MREDANRISLIAVRQVLAGAMPLDLEIEGAALHVEPQEQPQPSWPRVIAGLDPDADGPWPTPVDCLVTWDGGRTHLLVDASPTPRGAKTNSDLIGLRVSLPDARRELVWSTVATYLSKAKDGEDVTIRAWMTTWKKQSNPEGHYVRNVINAVKAVASRSGLPMLSKSSVEAFRVQVPTGAVSPDTPTAFRRIVHAALIKLPFLLRDAPEIIEGSPYLDIGDLVQAGLQAAPAATASDKLSGLWPLPGGVRQFTTTLNELLGWLSSEPRTQEQLEQHIRDRYDVTGPTALHTYTRLLSALDLGVIEGDTWVLTPAGEEYIADPRATRLFAILDSRFLGVLETLIIAGLEGGATTTKTLALLNVVLEKDWQSDNQASFRRNWLLSMGLTERTPTGDILTESGRQVLNSIGERAQRTREELEAALDAMEHGSARIGELPDEDGLELTIEAEEPLGDGEPAGWRAERLDLETSHVEAHLSGLCLAPTVMSQAVAALSAGKHLLLVGPPGTGKTQLAEALCGAAAAEGYCQGPLMTTASADWTTFDTIGGYHLRKDSSLTFRPGVFLRAIESCKWLLVDELNRADVDRAFGELMTVLAGTGTVTPFQLDDGDQVSVGPESGRSHWVPKTFRVLATMNTWDKTSLFRLSYAVQRRFAMLHVEPPDDATYTKLIDRWALGEGPDTRLAEAEVPKLRYLFSRSGLLRHRAVGPAVAQDLMRYLRRRRAGGDGVAEGLTLYLLPQLEGLDPEPAVRTFELLNETLTGWASQDSIGAFRSRYAELFPHLKLPEPS